MSIIARPQITKSEWKWAVIMSVIVVTLIMLPYLLTLNNVGTSWTFMGFLVNPKDGASYLAKIHYGMNGHWLYEIQHTPTAHQPAWVFSFYLLLGQLARLTGIAPVWMFQLSRFLLSIFMYMSFYWLGSVFWDDIKTRRRFFWLIGLVSGLGWVIAIATSGSGDINIPDLTTPEAFPFYASNANPHFPLTIGCLVLMTGILWRVFSQEKVVVLPTLQNGGVVVFFCSLIIAIVQPPALLIITATCGLIALWQWIKDRQFPWQAALWGVVILLPALPVFLYYNHVFSDIPFWRDYDANASTITKSPTILALIASYFILIVAGLPAIINSIKQPSQRNRIMLVWLGLNLVAIYLPYAFQRRFLVSLIIPMTFFAIEGLSFYIQKPIIQKRGKLFVFLAILAILPSHLITILAPIALSLGNKEDGEQIAGVVLPSDYDAMFDWFDLHANEGDVLLASPPVSQWVPGKTPVRVVFGHEYESLPSELRETQVENFYAGVDCASLFDDEIGFTIDFVVWGETEQRYQTDLVAEEDGNTLSSTSHCIETIQSSIPDEHQLHFGETTVYIMDSITRSRLQQSKQEPQ